MSAYDKVFRVEMTHGQDIREVHADLFKPLDDWTVFFRKPPTGGGPVEHWRARTDCIVSIETRKAKP